VAEFADAVRIVRESRVERRRGLAPFTVSKRVYIAVGGDRTRTGRRLEDWFGRFYRTSGLSEKVAVWGEPDDCVTRLSEVAARGADLIILNPVFDEMEQIERLASQVLPRVQGRD
jgi:alkanesulfonate monooxygenase SsuD/methylene tetrahydromethanopterin reductase-like flavin-dependent oxidoreductase (luciferase family)